MALLLVALAHGALYALVMPPWQAPDEVSHFENSYLMAALGRPLSPTDDSPLLQHTIILSLYRYHAWTYLGVPSPAVPPQRLKATPFGYYLSLDRFSLAYVVYAAAVLPFLNRGLVFQLYVMRFVSVIIGALVVGVAFETARLISPDYPDLALCAAAFVLFLPQHAFITASVSNGNLAEFAASSCVYFLVVMWAQGIRWTRVALALACAIAALLSKATAYFLVPLLLVAGPALTLRWRASAQHKVGLALGVVVGLSAALTLAITRVPPLHFILDEIGANVGHMANFGEYLLALNAAGRFSTALWGIFTSFWVTFGWMNVAFPTVVYMILLGLTAISVTGLFWRPFGLPGQARPYQVLGLAVVLAIAVVIGWFVTSGTGLTYYQGRYLFGAIVPIAILLAAGWLALVPIRFRSLATLLFLICLVLFDAAAVFGLAWPYFYRPGLT